MGQVLHGSATTTEAVRRAIQHSQESLRALAVRYSINQKTVAKWKNRETVSDRRTGPSVPKSTVLSIEEEAIIVAFRRHTLLPLDDCLYALQPTIPRLTRSSLHRCLQRHGIGRLPDIGGDKPAKKKFKAYPIGYFHIDIAEVQTADGKLYLFVAVDRTSKFAFCQLVEKANRKTASAFLEELVEEVPYKIHTVLTDNGIQFLFPPRHADGPTARYITHMFDMRCRDHGIEHRFTKINHPWTNGQVERMNRTIKDATVHRYHYDNHNQLRQHLGDFINTYNFARRLKTLKGLTPYEFICKCWTNQPEKFTLNPIHQMPGLNIAGSGRTVPWPMNDQPMAELLLQDLPAGADVIADKGYDADWIRDLIEDQDCTPHIPPKAGRYDGITYSKRKYKKRNLIERCFNKLKQFRHIATRYDRSALNYLAMAKLACIRLWLRFYESTA